MKLKVLILSVKIAYKFLFTAFFFKPLFTQKEKLNLKTYNSTLLDIYRISVGEKLKTLKENIGILKCTHK